MNSNEIKNLDSQYVMQTYGRFDTVIEKGQGATLWSPEGKKYIDFSSGIGVNSVGYNDPKWVEAVASQAGKLAHISNLFYSEPYAALAEKLCKRSGMKRAFFSNSGAEANEGLIKLARKYSFDKYGAGRGTVVTLVNSFHGRTVTTLAATGQDKFHNYFFPFTEGFKYALANSMESLLEAADDSVCAVMMEAIQGEGGVLPLDREYVEAVAKLCKEKDWLLLMDEVQTGVGRTGTLFAFMQYGITPDAISFAKGIGGGLPLGGILASDTCDKVLSAGTHATTFGGNPICCAGACAVLDILSDEALADVKKKGEYIRGKIEGMKLYNVLGTRGMGLMIGVPVRGYKPAEYAAKLIDSGLLCMTAGSDALRFLPPLTITKEEIDEGLEIFERVMRA